METPNLNEVGRKLTQEERIHFGLPLTNTTDDLVVSSTTGEIDPSQTTPTPAELSAFNKSNKIWRLTDGTLTQLGPGRPPKGAVCVYTPASTPKVARTTTKTPVMLRLADGSIVKRGKGRPPKGSTVIDPGSQQV
jgi:hypothetical protein